MRRISTRSARPGMVTSRTIYDSRGQELFFAGSELGKDDIATLVTNGIGELLIEDPRVADVPAQPLVPPEVEADAVRALRQYLTQSKGARAIDQTLVVQVERAIAAMVRSLFPDVIGEINASGCPAIEDFDFIHPPKVAILCMLMGRRLGLDKANLTRLGLAAILMNTGYLYISPGVTSKGADLTPAEDELLKKHPQIGHSLLAGPKTIAAEVGDAILQHHERWDGSGYPYGHKGEEIPLYARIIAIADAYYDLVSKRQGRAPLMPHETVEYIMAYSGEWFDPEMVAIFSRQVPLYPTGITIKLNTGEMAIVTNANVGHIGRPVARICRDSRGVVVREPYDLDLTDLANQDRLVVEVLDY